MHKFVSSPQPLNLMQDLLKKIFEKAYEEIPHRLFIFGNEKVIMYRGFRISEVNGNYQWLDMRNDSFYDKVDPIITEHVIKNGFLKTLTEMLVHNDKERLYLLKKELQEKGMMVKYWTSKSSENYRDFKKAETAIISNTGFTQEQIEYKLETLSSRYLKRKNLYAKKRKVLKEEQQNIENRISFFESRIRLYS